jgi:hypothetical protein
MTYGVMPLALCCFCLMKILLFECFEFRIPQSEFRNWNGPTFLWMILNPNIPSLTPKLTQSFSLSPSDAVDDLRSPRLLEIHFETAIEAAKINHLPVLQFK